MFLKYPNLFYSDFAPHGRTISPVNVDLLGRVSRHEESTVVPDGIFLSWGTPGEPRHNGYYYTRNKASSVTREITNFERFGTGNNSFSFTVGEQKKVFFGKSSWSYSSDNSGQFAKLTAFDEMNMAILNAIPDLQESFRLFATETANWWMQDIVNNRHSSRAPHRFADVTTIITDQTAKVANENIARLADSTTEKRKWEMKTHRIAGFYAKNVPHVPHVYRKRTEADGSAVPGDGAHDWVEVITTSPINLRTWKVSEKDKKKNKAQRLLIGNEPLPTCTSTALPMKAFDVHFEFSNLDNFEVRFQAHYTWVKGQNIVDLNIEKRTNRYTNRSEDRFVRTENLIYLPVISGLVMELIPRNKTDNSTYYRLDENAWEAVSEDIIAKNEDNPYSITELVRVRDKTKKRAIKGAYRGGYQGIQTLTFNNRPLIDFIRVTGLSAIAKGPTIAKFDLPNPKRIPLSLEEFKKIDRPKVDIKPIEIGHLRFYRLSNPPKQQMRAEILSDLLLPSMPELLIAAGAHIRITSNDTYINGEGCSGKCSEESIDANLPPGLYLVNRHEKCALGHDPGRSEYTNGFGDISNETITLRRLLSQLIVTYDEYRGNMVGSNINQKSSLTSMSTTESGLFGRL